MLCKHSSLKTLKRQISKTRNFLIWWDNQVHNLTARLFFSEKINRLYLAAFYLMGSFDANFRPLMLNTLNDWFYDNWLEPNSKIANQEIEFKRYSIRFISLKKIIPAFSLSYFVKFAKCVIWYLHLLNAAAVSFQFDKRLGFVFRNLL